MLKPLKTVKGILRRSHGDKEAQLFECLSSIPVLQLSSVFFDVWTLCSEEMSNGPAFLRLYLSIRPLSIEEGTLC